MFVQDQNLGGNPFKKVKKVLKKVAKPVAHIAAAYFTGGASLQLSAKMIADKKAQKAAGKQEQQFHAQEAAAMGETVNNFDSAAYKAINKDKKVHKMSHQAAFDHWVKYGRKAGVPFPSVVGSGSSSTAAWAPQTTAYRAALPYTPITSSVAQSASGAMQYLQPPGNATYEQDSFAPGNNGTPESATPPWMIPAALGGGVLLLALMSKKGRS